jgi:thymidylate kinase
MRIEFIGCTSAGKTTLAKKMVRMGQAQGIDARLSDDFILGWSRLDWITNDFIQRRVIELLAFGACLVSCWKHREFYRFVLEISRQAPGSWLYKLSVARITLRKIGIYEIVRRFSTEKQVVLLDNEGVLQGSHTLFVHSEPWPHERDLDRFVTLAPLADVVVYFRQSLPVLIARTHARGHRRIPDGEQDKADVFIKQAVELFEVLHRHPAIADRLLVIECEQNTLRAGYDSHNSIMAKADKLILAGLGAEVCEPVSEGMQ